MNRYQRGSVLILCVVLVVSVSGSRADAQVVERRGRLGVTLVENGGVGVKVGQVFPGSPAADCSVTEKVNGEVKRMANATLAPGDLIVFAQGRPVRSAAELNQIITTVRRNNELRLEGLDATKGWKVAYTAYTQLDRDGPAPKVYPVAPSDPGSLNLQPPRGLLGRRVGIAVNENDGVGVVIGEVFADTPAVRFVVRTANGEQANSLAPNDLIVFANDQPVRSERGLLQIISGLAPGSALRIAGLDQSTNWQTPFQGYLIIGQ
jgi:S1-C subfamily serine protease